VHQRTEPRSHKQSRSAPAGNDRHAREKSRREFSSNPQPGKLMALICNRTPCSGDQDMLQTKLPAVQRGFRTPPSDPANSQGQIAAASREA